MLIALRRYANASAFSVLAAAAVVACSSDPSDAPATDAGTHDPSSPDASTPNDSAPDADVPEAAAPGDAGTTDSGTEASSYDVTYEKVGDGLFVGKSTFRLVVKNHDTGAPATGLAGAIKIAPVMDMGTMSHGGPVPPDAVVESATPGTYDVTLFFPMASVDEGGNPAGKWTLSVRVGAHEPKAIEVPVAKAPTADTTHKALQHSGDQTASMGAKKNRKYMIFRDSLKAGGAGHELSVFVATIEEGGMVWPPVVPGLVLKDAAGNVQLTVSDLALSASTDGTTWQPMACTTAARCTASLSGLAAGTPGKVYVKLKVNGNDYTVDGTAPDGEPDLTKTNAFATFAVTP